MPKFTEVALVTLITSGMKLYRQNIQRANATNSRATEKQSGISNITGRNQKAKTLLRLGCHNQFPDPFTHSLQSHLLMLSIANETQKAHSK